MYITKVKITNFKCFKDVFTLELTDGLNIIVGNNEAGKSTILQAIHLALSGFYNGKYLKNEISEYLFNNTAVAEYRDSLGTTTVLSPPEIIIEIFLSADDLALFEGDDNSERRKACGLKLKICLDDKFKAEYEDYMQQGLSGLPIEYYEFNWSTFARENITTKKIPLKSALIDSSSSRYQNGSDIYISHIIKDYLDEKQRNSLVQEHRKLQSSFNNAEAVKKVNEVIKQSSVLAKGDREVKLSVDLSSKNAWENSFLTYVEDVPFQNVGKGEQAIVKTKLALQHKKAKEASIILLEEPENHLSHSKLNVLLKDIQTKCSDKQIVISTHSSFVANKLGLQNLILLNNRNQIRLNVLDTTTQNFFKKIPGYDTLRIILCKKAFLVEGDSDELIVQRAYLDKHGFLPIEEEIDVISVGTSFLRFLEISTRLLKPVVVITDNDGDIEALKTKYMDFLGTNAKPFIKICFDEEIDSGKLMIGNSSFNYNTLEPKIVKANHVSTINRILGRDDSEDDLHRYMKTNKTECALKIFDSHECIKYPKYIMDAITEEK